MATKDKNSSVVCLRCGSVDDYNVEQSGPHLKAICNGCDRYIKFISKHKNQSKMADKIIKLKIDVKKLNKQWLFKGEKGTYADITLLYNEEEDSFGQCGMVVQDVPKVIREKDSSIKGPILGNAKEFAKTGSETKPGVESGVMGAAAEDEDLPF